MDAVVEDFASPLQPTNESCDIDVVSIRSSILHTVKEEGLYAFDGRDIERISLDDHYIRRFVAENGHDLNKTRKNILETLRWRKRKGINDVTILDVDDRLFVVAPMAAHNRDRDGCKMFIFTVRKHSKTNFGTGLLKKCLIYWLERLEREEYGSQLTLLFDFKEATMNNVDMEYVKYMITVLDNYYPWLLSKVIILDMPWILNVMWNIIKSWLPAKAGGLIHFIGRKRLGELVTPDQCLAEWGGDDFIGVKFQDEVDPSQKPWLLVGSNINYLYYARKRIS